MGKVVIINKNWHRHIETKEDARILCRKLNRPVRVIFDSEDIVLYPSGRYRKYSNYDGKINPKEGE